MNLLLKDKSVGRSENTRGGGKSVIESHLMKQGLLLFMQKSRWGGNCPPTPRFRRPSNESRTRLQGFVTYVLSKRAE